LDPPWRISNDDCAALAKLAGELETAIALADSPHYQAYLYAYIVLRDDSLVCSRAREAIVRMLEIDDARPTQARVALARKLAALGDPRGAPLVAWEIAELASDRDLGIAPSAADAIATALVDAALIGGHDACDEKRMIAACNAARVHVPIGELDARILEGAMT